MILPSVSAILPYNMTHTQGAPVRQNDSSSPTTPFALPVKPQWSPGDIGTLVFGLIASLLGVLTLWVTFRLGRQRVVENGLYTHKEAQIKPLIDMPVDERRESGVTRTQSVVKPQHWWISQVLADVCLDSALLLVSEAARISRLAMVAETYQMINPALPSDPIRKPHHPLPYLSGPDPKYVSMRHNVFAYMYDIILHPISLEVHHALMELSSFSYKLGTQLVKPRLQTATKGAQPEAYSVNP
ncbi:hypothetical protein BDR22DRAFT_823296 [Usnea florida]